MPLEPEPKEKSSTEMLLLYRNLFSHYLETAGMFVSNLLGSHGHNFDPQPTHPQLL